MGDFGFTRVHAFLKGFQKYSFKICSFNHKKSFGLFYIFHRPDFFRLVPYVFFNKKSFKLLFINNFTVIVSKIRVLGQKTTGKGATRPPSLFRFKLNLKYSIFNNGYLIPSKREIMAMTVYIQIRGTVILNSLCKARLMPRQTLATKVIKY